jgi:hypothetical protein
MTHGKVKTGVFTGPQICKLIRDTFFETSMNQLEKKKAWQSFRNIVEYFLRNRREVGLQEYCAKFVANLKNLRCNMSLKLHFLHLHLTLLSTEC